MTTEIAASQVQSETQTTDSKKQLVSLEDYLEHYAAHHYEWVEGELIATSPASLKHNKLMKYLSTLLDAFFEFRPIGECMIEPFVLKLAAFPNRRREPDLMIVLEANRENLTETAMEGPPDIVIEIVSPESVARDHGDKFAEYETGGVPEYWIIDPLREECRFYRLGEAGLYVRQEIDTDDQYRTPVMPDFALHVPTLWLDKLPAPGQIVKVVQAMVGG